MILLWDFFASILVVFPLLTGGIWIKRPGLFIELSELSVPVIIVTLLAVLLRYGFKADLKQSYILRATERCWNRWREALETRPARTLLMGWIFFTFLLALSAIRRHYSFESSSWDLGIYHNAIWNFVHGNGYISAPKEGMNEFIDHQSFSFLLLAPLVKLFPKPEALLIIQACWLSAAGVLAYYLSLQYLPRKHWAVAAFPLLVWVYNPLRHVNSFDFHPETMMLSLFLGGIIGVQSPKWRYRALGCFSLLIALFSRESAGPIAMGIGFAWLLGSSPKRSRTFSQVIAVALILVGPVIFYFDLNFVPKLAGGPYPYHDLYKQFGEGIPSILLAPIQKPRLFLATIFAKSRFGFFFWMLAPLGFIPLLNPRTFIATLPPFVILFLTNGDLRVNLLHHYSIEETIGIFWAFPRGVIYFEHYFANRRKNLGSARGGDSLSFLSETPKIWLLFFAFAAMGRSELFRPRYFTPTAHHLWLKNAFLPAVDPEVTLSVTDNLVPHLTDRYWARNPMSQVISSYSIQYPTARQNPLAGQLVQCVIEDTALTNYPMNEQMTEEFHRKLPVLGYLPVYTCGSIHVWSQAQNPTNCLTRTVPCVE